MSLSALFEVQNTQITNPPTPSDFLRSLLGTLNEFEQSIGSVAEKAGVGMMMGLADTEGRGKMVRKPFCLTLLNNPLCAEKLIPTIESTSSTWSQWHI